MARGPAPRWCAVSVSVTVYIIPVRIGPAPCPRRCCEPPSVVVCCLSGRLRPVARSFTGSRSVSVARRGHCCRLPPLSLARPLCRASGVPRAVSSLVAWRAVDVDRQPRATSVASLACVRVCVPVCRGDDSLVPRAAVVFVCPPKQLPSSLPTRRRRHRGRSSVTSVGRLSPPPPSASEQIAVPQWLCVRPSAAPRRESLLLRSRRLVSSPCAVVVSRRVASAPYSFCICCPRPPRPSVCQCPSLSLRMYMWTRPPRPYRHPSLSLLVRSPLLRRFVRPLPSPPPPLSALPISQPAARSSSFAASSLPSNVRRPASLCVVSLCRLVTRGLCAVGCLASLVSPGRVVRRRPPPRRRGSFPSTSTDRGADAAAVQLCRVVCVYVVFSPLPPAAPPSPLLPLCLCLAVR